ncbi:hypothetical protein CHARACLAT_011097 [Characodon lateralis]|uniref:Uncharacterized protein n=1 Tax=Characodon lateralis TaxID=208331 RepID=A0ABU7D6F9_9TELE|nr:hypothetical protein [Characodon lateralis]
MKEEPEEPDTLHIKGKHGELCISQDEEQLPLKQEVGSFLVNTVQEEEDHGEPESTRDQFFFQNSPEAGNQFWEGRNDEDSGSNREEEWRQHERSSQSGDQLDESNALTG